MIILDENALICDLAETYHIYDYRQLPASQVAILSVGLGDDSRIKRKIAGSPVTEKTMLLLAVLDRLDLLLWMNSEDGAKGRNRPTSILQTILQKEESGDLELFEDGEALEEYLKKAREEG